MNVKGVNILVVDKTPAVCGSYELHLRVFGKMLTSCFRHWIIVVKISAAGDCRLSSDAEAGWT